MNRTRRCFSARLLRCRPTRGCTFSTIGVRPLETFWVLYHTPRPGTLVRDPWELKEKAAGHAEAYILARRMDAPLLATIGTVEPVLESEKSRMEPSPEYRRVLYRVNFFPVAAPAPPELLARTRRTLW